MQTPIPIYEANGDLMTLKVNWKAAHDWYLARKQRAGISAAGDQIKAGNLRGAIDTFEKILPRLRDRTMRSLVLHRLVKVRLQFATRLAKADKERASQREFRATMRLLGQEVSTGSLSPGKSISLIGFTLDRLTRHNQLPWISELRSAPPPVSKQSKSPVEHLEDMTLAKALTPSSAIELIGKTSPHDAPMAWWMTMHDLLYRQGHVRAAVAAKHSAASAFLARSDPSFISAMDLAAVVCLNDRDRIEAAISAATSHEIKRDGWLAIGEIERARELDASLQSYTDKRYARWMNGKSVAVVGPARNTLQNGKSIDEYDRVVRTNFISNDAFRAAASMIGTRTDAAYYNSIFLQRQPEAVVQTLKTERVKFTMLRTPIERIRIGWQTRGRRTREYYFTSSVFMARGFAMRHILQDLVLTTAREITCYGSDFFLGADSHFAGYATWRHAFEHAESYIVHDPLDCWRFMRRMLDAGLIKVDAVLGHILKLDEADFILALERRFEKQSLTIQG
jgi:hypothetical protein